MLWHYSDCSHLTKELGKELTVLWQAFGQKLAEAEAFVTKQTPIKAQGLQESIQVGG